MIILLHFSIMQDISTHPRIVAPRRRAQPLVWDGTSVNPEQLCSADSWHVQPRGSSLHRHMVLELLWNEAPLTLRVLDRTFALNQPTVVILPPGTLHIAEPIGQSFSRRLIGRNLSIREEALHGAENRLQLRSAILRRQHSQLLLPLLRHIHSRIRSDAPPAQPDFAELLAGLCALLRDLGYATPRPAPVVTSAIDRALEVLYKRHTDPTLRVADLARAAGLSEPHFRRLFVLHTGNPPHRLLARLRVYHARQLMARRHIKATSAAAQTGFGSVSAMYKQLQQHTR